MNLESWIERLGAGGEIGIWKATNQGFVILWRRILVIRKEQANTYELYNQGSMAFCIYLGHDWNKGGD